MSLITTVPKEAIGSAAFAAQDVLTQPVAVANRRRRLQRALSLGNLHRHKVTLTYRLYDQVPQRVITTVWAVTEQYITLKGGRIIPVRAIESVDW